MDSAYGHKVRNRKLDTAEGEVILGFEDLVERAGKSPTRHDVEMLAPADERVLARLISSRPKSRRERIVWGCLVSIAADRSSAPLNVGPGDFSGIELRRGTVIIDAGERHDGDRPAANRPALRSAANRPVGDNAGDHIGERMSGGRIIINGSAGDYLGQEMSGGGITAISCGNYAFKGMSGGWGVVRGSAGSFLGLGCRGGRIVARGNAKERAGWLMRGGRISILGDAGEYLGILMSGGEILVRGRAGKRAGWRMKGGSILAGDIGDEAGAGALGGEIIRRSA